MAYLQWGARQNRYIRAPEAKSFFRYNTTPTSWWGCISLSPSGSATDQRKSRTVYYCKCLTSVRQCVRVCLCRDRSLVWCSCQWTRALLAVVDRTATGIAVEPASTLAALFAFRVVLAILTQPHLLTHIWYGI